VKGQFLGDLIQQSQIQFAVEYGYCTKLSQTNGPFYYEFALSTVLLYATTYFPARFMVLNNQGSIRRPVWFSQQQAKAVHQRLAIVASKTTYRKERFLASNMHGKRVVSFP